MTHLPYGKTASGPWSVEITPSLAGWTYSGLRVADLTDAPISFDTGEEEMIVLPLAGSCTVTLPDDTFVLTGRASVFDSPSDFAYVPTSTQVTVEGAGRIAFPSARATRAHPARYVAAAEVAVEIRGAGQASRQVNNFCSPDAYQGCDKLMAVEVLTPSGNWSSYPPHKHDTPHEGEAVLEEIYYFEVADQGIGYQRVYSSERGHIDTLAEVSSGDVVLVPYGYHGPSMAAPGYDLYYLNVLAGPAEQRSMAFCDDPRHAWIRSSWDTQHLDPRLPFGRTS
ncbi:5-deoxy-glucuronate isomerase [[Actinomadura] parvosata subsp. kistnae]|uniref:5-deoxy-glucuronate isomerase n=1 Tax=[Actinomadura] parvosata subsp. kistnae TaxID=1909395 RepID=A0A1V0A758_9ACTN|nr:5-deoxy-glucuronate isomerase [Nonomuraea sp. ATCC 55076]AQZ66038.1 5-deoxy-glucuronate isomerase [Nonomuraea sp. ATCC 55076]SPL97513.1 5-deoxy-glucuronate isomerase [Actinomadura parvosata subsp. kistnae]